MSWVDLIHISLLGSYVVVKNRLTVGMTGEYSSVIDCGKKLPKWEGALTFFKSYVPNLTTLHRFRSSCLWGSSFSK
jgi:hypothetical protein